jgi:DNA (cytosine-5)-methyltransferase 1
VAFEPLGWRPLAFSEIEAFPRAVLKYHYPDTPCHGDFTTLKDEPWIVDADLLCGGTPCQAFSVAGNASSSSSPAI